MNVVQKMKLCNFKKFREFEVSFDEKMNIFVGDNEAGKSSLLLALDIVLSGSRSKVESLTLENLFNTNIVAEFLSGTKHFNDLPLLWIELYLSDQSNPDLNGRNNSDNITCDGLRLICEPLEELSKEIQEILRQPGANFPFEYYSIRFVTFADQTYSGYRKFLKHLLLDSSQISNEYATREYIKTVYRKHVADTAEIHRHHNEYRRHKNEFKTSVLDNIVGLSGYKFAIRSDSKTHLENDLTITEENIALENRGKGKQSIIKTEFALQKNRAGTDLNVLLLEEPENHLSHTNMKKLVQTISESNEMQLFVATHSPLISL
jgi:predicted ATP-dependent endonuclease of OLD family